MKKQETKRNLIIVQRMVLLKGIYVFHNMILVVTGAFSIDFLIEERMKVWKVKEARCDCKEHKTARREEPLDEWQRRCKTSYQRGLDCCPLTMFVKL